MPHKSLIFYYLSFALICLLCGSHIFFWDTYQLCGKQAWALYEQGLLNWILPAEIDSGHPPLFGFYHAFLWKFSKPNLLVSHLGMIPFLCGIIYSIYEIGAHYLDRKKAIFLLPLLLADPVFMGQAVLVSPDIVLVCFMLSCWLGLLRGNKLLIGISAIFLGLISMRGMMVLAALILFDFLLLNRGSSFQNRTLKLTKYAPAVLLVLTFLVYHYVQTGWLGHHKDSSWSASFAYVDFQGGLRNIAVYIWRILDFGRVFLLGAFLFLIFRNKEKLNNEKVKQIGTLLLLITVIISPILIVHKGLVLHRYMLPIFLSLSVFFWYFLFASELKDRSKKILYTIVLIGLFTGNFWVYPKQISQGWDATLGHLPYYSLRDKMIAYLDEAKINLDEVGTAFPNIGPLRNFDPDVERIGFKEYDLNQDEYVFYSNIYNDFTDQELDRLDSSEWMIDKEMKFYPVCIILYKRNK